MNSGCDRTQFFAASALIKIDAPRSTKDIDIFWLDEEGLQRAYAPLRESVQIIKQRHDLDADWLNYLAQMLMYDEVIVPEGRLWKRFGPLHVYAPPREYILALKIAAGRDKDLADCALLLSKTRIIQMHRNTSEKSPRHLLLVATSFALTGSTKINMSCTNGFTKPSPRA